VHLRLAALTGDPTHTERAEQTLATLAGALQQMPLGFGELLRALERLLGAQTEVAIVGPEGADRDALVDVYHAQWRPSAVLAVGAPGRAAPVALLENRPLREGRATAYVCQNFACEQPVTEPEELSAQLARVAVNGRTA
jgi:hypothetical protein